MTPSPPTGILLIRFNEGVVFLWLSKRETPEHHLRLASRRSENTVTSFRTFDYDHNLEYRARFQSRLRSIRLYASDLPADTVNRRRISNPPAALRQSIMGIPKTSDNDLSRKGLMTVQAVSVIHRRAELRTTDARDRVSQEPSRMPRNGAARPADRGALGTRASP